MKCEDVYKFAIPAQTGIHLRDYKPRLLRSRRAWIPAYTGMTV